jgi:hypothetical protein
MIGKESGDTKVAEDIELGKIYTFKNRIVFYTEKTPGKVITKTEFHFKGGYLDASDSGLVNFLRTYYMSLTLDKLQTVLLRFDYKSKSGLPLEPIHISNFLRKDLGLRKVREYEKPNYKGCNWHMFV